MVSVKIILQIKNIFVDIIQHIEYIIMNIYILFIVFTLYYIFYIIFRTLPSIFMI